MCLWCAGNAISPDVDLRHQPAGSHGPRDRLELTPHGLPGSGPYKYGWGQISDVDTTSERVHVRASQTSGQPDLRIKIKSVFNVAGYTREVITWDHDVLGDGPAIDTYLDDTTPFIGVSRWELYLCTIDDLSDCHLWDTWPS